MVDDHPVAVVGGVSVGVLGDARVVARASSLAGRSTPSLHSRWQRPGWEAWAGPAREAIPRAVGKTDGASQNRTC